MDRFADSTARFDSRLLLETSRLLMESREPSQIARNLGLVLMGKLLVGQAAVLMKAEDGGGYEIAFLRGRSPLKEGKRIERGPEDGSMGGRGGIAEALFPAASGQWERTIGTEKDRRGLIVFGLRDGQQPFDADQIDLIESMCNLAAMALDNAAAIHELRVTNRALDRRLHELGTLFDLSREFGAQLDPHRIADVLKFTLMGHLAVRQAMIAVRMDARGAAEGGGWHPDGVIALMASGGLRRQPSEQELSECFKRMEMSVDGSLSGDAAAFAADERIAAMVGIQSSAGGLEAGHLRAVIGVGRKLDGSVLSADDVQFIRSISNLGLMAMDNARLLDQMIEKRRMQEELSIARRIQRQLIPDPIPRIPGLDAAAVNIPSTEVGGDYVDVAQTPDGNVICAIADVSGKGVPASLLMANLQAMIQVLLPIDITLSDAVGRINDLIHEHTPSDRFITFFLAKYHHESSRLDYVNAGHNPPMLFRGGGATEPERLEEGGMLLGALPTMQPYGMGSIVLAEEDVIVMFTDGVTEALNREGTEEFGEDRLAAAVSSLAQAGSDADDILEGILEEVRRFGSDVFSDDLTALVLKKRA